MNKLSGILFSLCLLFAYGCTEEAKKESPASTSPVAAQGQDQHVSGDDTPVDHLSGTPSSSDSHMSGS